MSERPNILWICTDQQRADSLGCYGNAFVRTPTIDRLAGTGALFEHAYCQSPVCTPSRASFLTGRYPRTTRCRQNGQSIPSDEVLVTRLLADAGYVCGLSGKLHISACHPSACPGIERRIDDGYADFHWSHDPGPQWIANEYWQWLNEIGASFPITPVEGSDWVRFGVPAKWHHTTWCAQKAVTFIERAAEMEHPWLFSVNMFDPHDPWAPPEEYLAPYLARLDELPPPNYVEGELENKPIFQQIGQSRHYCASSAPLITELGEREHRLIRAAYWAMVDLIDAQVGRLLDTLERTGQAPNTIVVFTTDHGEMLGDHGLFLKGPWFYEPVVRMPLVVAWPGHVVPQRSNALVELMDIAPTLLEAAGLPVHPGMQARSLWPLLTGTADAGHHRDDVYSEYYNVMPTSRPPAAYATMLRTERHKLVAVHGRDEGELYDLAEDPQETTNLWLEPALQTVKVDMLKRLCDHMAETVDPLPPREGPW